MQKVLIVVVLILLTALPCHAATIDQKTPVLQDKMTIRPDLLPAKAKTLPSIVIWTNRPDYYRAYEAIQIFWRVTGGTPDGINCVEWDTVTSEGTPPPTSYRYKSPNIFEAPYMRAVDGQATTGYIFARVHARVEGLDYYSSPLRFTILPWVEITSAPISYFEPVRPGGPVTIKWKVYGGTPTTNRIVWSSEWHTNLSPPPPLDQTTVDCLTMPYQATLTAPNHEGYLAFFRVYAVVNGFECRSDIRSFDIRTPTVSILASPTSAEAGTNILVSWDTMGWPPEGANRVLWGTSPTAFTHSTGDTSTKPYRMTFPAPGTIGPLYLKVRSNINGVEYDSAVKTVTVVPVQPRFEFIEVPTMPRPGLPITVRWNVVGGTPVGTHTLEWGTSATALTNRTGNTFTVPYQVTFTPTALGPIFWRVHAMINGADYYSPMSTFMINPTITVTGYPTAVAPGGAITVTWTVNGGTPTQTNRVLWGTTNTYFPNKSADILTAPYRAMLTAPTTTGTVYFKVIAEVDGRGCYTVELPVKVQAPTITILAYPKNVSPGTIVNVGWAIVGAMPGETNRVEWGTAQKSFDNKTGNGTTMDKKIPYQVAFTSPSTPGIISLRVHSVINGLDYYSETVMIPCNDQFRQIPRSR